MKLALQGLLGAVVLNCILPGCSPGPAATSIAEKDVPYTKRFVMKDGDAARFKLPSGKIVAVWCERPQFPSSGEQVTASGLKTAWGERPFVRPEITWKRQPDGSQVASGWKSYIEQGSVITTGSARTSEYILYVDKWQFSIIEDLASPADLPVTIKVTHRPMH